LATGVVAAEFGPRPKPFYLGVGYVVLGTLLSVCAVRETRQHVMREVPLNAQPAGEPLSQRAVFTRTSLTDPDLSAVCQAGLVNNLNDGMAWGLFPLVFAAAGLSLAHIGALAAIYPAVWGLAQFGTGASSQCGCERRCSGSMVASAKEAPNMAACLTSLRSVAVALGAVASFTAGCDDAQDDTEARMVDARPADARPVDARPADARPVDARPVDARMADARPADAAPPPAPPPPPSGLIEIEACRGETGVNERCTLVTNATACVSGPCDRLVVVFSGGEMGCVSGAGYSSVLEGYASRGYAAVCINYFETPEGSGTAPYLDEAERLDLAVREATTGPWARAYWSGRDLLLEGISHGATAPVILMARTRLDEQAHWRGSHFTAGCFFDGSYDQVATAELLRTGARGGSPCMAPVSYNRGLERYCGPGATEATCDLSANEQAQLDTVTEVLPATFAVNDLMMVECGSARPACSGDIIPGAPIERLCTRLEASQTHTCRFVALPNDGHLTCHSNEFDQCRRWFEARLQAP